MSGGADWSTPSSLATLYADVLTDLKDRDVDALTLQKTAPSNLPVGAIRWNRSDLIFEEWNGATWVTLVIDSAGGGTGGTSPSTARTALGLGSMATQNSGAVSITGGSIAGVTMAATVITSGTLPLNRGGTGNSIALGAAGTVLQSNGAAVVFGSDGSQFTNLNGSNVSSGTVAPSRLGSGVVGAGLKFLADNSAFVAPNAVIPAQVGKTTTYTLTNADDIVLCNGAFTLTLLACSAAIKKFFYIKNLHATALVTVARAGSDTIEGGTSYVLFPGDAITIYANGTNWYIL